MTSTSKKSRWKFKTFDVDEAARVSEAASYKHASEASDASVSAASAAAAAAAAAASKICDHDRFTDNITSRSLPIQYTRSG